MSKQGKHEPKPGTPPSKREEKAAQKEGPSSGNMHVKRDASSGTFLPKTSNTGRYVIVSPQGEFITPSSETSRDLDVNDISARRAAPRDLDVVSSPARITVEQIRALATALKGGPTTLSIEKEPAMAGPTTESLSSDLKEHRAEFRKTADDVIRIGTEVGIFKWAIGLVAVTLLSGGASGIWWASGINGRVGSLEDRVTKVENRLTAIEGRLGEMDKHLVAIDATLGRILDRLPMPAQEKR